MAVVNQIYTVDASWNYAYSFVCEHCGADSGIIETKYPVVESVEKGVHVTENVRKATYARAQRLAFLRWVNAKDDAAKGRSIEGMNGTCSKCGKRQSWEVIPPPDWSFRIGLAGFILGFVAAVVIANSVHPSLVWPFFVGGPILGAVIGGVLGSILAKGKARKTDAARQSAVKNAPTAYLPQHLNPLFEGFGTQPPCEITLRSSSYKTLFLNGEKIECPDGLVKTSTSVAFNCVIAALTPGFFQVAPGGMAEVTVNKGGEYGIIEAVASSGITVLTEDEARAQLAAVN